MITQFFFSFKTYQISCFTLSTFTSICKDCSPGSSLPVWHLAFFLLCLHFIVCGPLCLQLHSHFSHICGLFSLSHFHCVLSKNQTKRIYVSISKAGFLYCDCKLLNLFQINSLSHLVLLHLCCHTNSFFRFFLAVCYHIL